MQDATAGHVELVEDEDAVAFDAEAHAGGEAAETGPDHEGDGPGIVSGAGLGFRVDCCKHGLTVAVSSLVYNLRGAPFPSETSVAD